MARPWRSWHSSNLGAEELKPHWRSALGVPEITSLHSEFLGRKEEFFIHPFIFGLELSSLEMQKKECLVNKDEGVCFCVMRKL